MLTSVGCLLALLAQAAPQDEPRQALGQFVNAAFQHSPQLSAGESRLAAARQQTVAAGKPLYNPSLELEAEDGEQRTYTAGISQTLDLFGKRAARGAVGQAQMDAARAREAALRQRIAGQVLQALADYDGARRQVVLAAKSGAVLQRFFEISQRLHQAGEIGDKDLSLARLAAANAIRDRAETERKAVAARQALALASRVPKSQWPALPTQPPPDAELPADEQAVNALVLDLPAVRRAQAEAAAGEQHAELARRRRHADPTVSLRGGREGDSDLVGLNLSLPLHLRNDFRAEAEAAAYQAEAARFSASDARNKARLRLVAARDRYRQARAAAVRWQALAGGRIEEGIKLLERLYRSGDLQATDYLTQLREHLDARANGVQLHTEAWQAWFAWLDASGRWRDWLMHAGEPHSAGSVK